VGIELRGTRHLEQGTAWKRAREARGLSQRGVAAHLGVHRDTVRRWEEGRRVADDVVPELLSLYRLTKPPTPVPSPDDQMMRPILQRLERIERMLETLVARR
jgi:transcriptional regulator with XRE-family HTH domain